MYCPLPINVLEYGVEVLSLEGRRLQFYILPNIGEDVSIVEGIHPEQD